MQTFFIMSSERSGSNLLRKMHGAHPDLAAPPPHLRRHLTQALPYYGPLDQDSNLNELLTDIIALTQIPDSHLKLKYVISLKELRSRITTRSLSDILVALHHWYAEQENAKGWVCKENNLFDHAFQIREVLSQAKFIYLCWDGRDYTCSIQRVPTHDQHVFFIAQEWRHARFWLENRLERQRQRRNLLKYPGRAQRDKVLEHIHQWTNRSESSYASPLKYEESSNSGVL